MLTFQIRETFQQEQNVSRIFIIGCNATFSEVKPGLSLVQSLSRFPGSAGCRGLEVTALLCLVWGAAVPHGRSLPLPRAFRLPSGLLGDSVSWNKSGVLRTCHGLMNVRDHKGFCVLGSRTSLLRAQLRFPSCSHRLCLSLWAWQVRLRDWEDL